MPELALPRVVATAAAQVAAPINTLDPDARALLAEGQSPAQYLTQLLEKEYHADAVRFLAHALPKREAVWWGCICAQQAAGNPLRAEAPPALQAAVTWVRDPSETNRRAAREPGEADDMNTPAGCLAMAAFWSGGSMHPPNLPKVPPPELLTNQVVAAAILLAAVADDAPRTDLNHRQFLSVGLGVAGGKYLWEV